MQGSEGSASRPLLPRPSKGVARAGSKPAQSRLQRFRPLFWDRQRTQLQFRVESNWEFAQLNCNAFRRQFKFEFPTFPTFPKFPHYQSERLMMTFLSTHERARTRVHCCPAVLTHRHPFMRAVPLLKPKHFDGLTTMIGGGLRFQVALNVDDWIAASPSIGASYADTEARLRKLAANRRPGRVELNPTKISSDDLLKACRASQHKLKGRETINVAYGLSDSFDREWVVDVKDRKWGFWRKSEGQSLVLVAFDDADKVVGYSSFGATCSAPIERSDKYSVRFEMDMVYVFPERRGSGFGLDLSIATGMVCQDIFQAYYRAVPSGAHLIPHIYADYESEGGEAITLHVRDELDCAVDMLREDRRRPSIVLSHTELDAGY